MKRLALCALVLGGCFEGPGQDGSLLADARPSCDEAAPGCILGCDGGVLDPCNAECGGVAYECNDQGKWQVAFECDPPPPLVVAGDVTFSQSLDTPSSGCPSFDVAPLRRITITDGAITDTDPLVIDSGTVTATDTEAEIVATAHDVWPTVEPTLSYDLHIDAWGKITGSASGSFDGCSFLLTISGTYP